MVKPTTYYSGQRFGFITLSALMIEWDGDRRTQWVLGKCDCGRDAKIISQTANETNSASCGCKGTKGRKHTLDSLLVGIDTTSHEKCWNWPRGLSSKGYGVGSAHRKSWLLHNGPIENGLFVLHKCNNKACINPNHLYLGTHRDNMDDLKRSGVLKGKGKVLTNKQEAEVRRMKAAGASYPEMRKKFGVSKNTLWKTIKNGEAKCTIL